MIAGISTKAVTFKFLLKIFAKNLDFVFYCFQLLPSIVLLLEFLVLTHQQLTSQLVCAIGWLSRFFLTGTLVFDGINKLVWKRSTKNLLILSFEESKLMKCCMFNVRCNGNTKNCENCSKLTLKMPEYRCCCNSNFFIKSEKVS